MSEGDLMLAADGGVWVCEGVNKKKEPPRATIRHLSTSIRRDGDVPDLQNEFKLLAAVPWQAAVAAE